MSPVKIIFYDIDGTLVDPGTRCISEKTKQTVKALRQKGILQCIVTGRPRASLPDFGDLVFDAMVTFNGSFSYTDKEVISSNPIDPADVQIVLQNAAALGRPVSVATKDRLSANGIDQDLADYYASMKPAAAAAIFEEMTGDLEKVASILTCMKKDQAGAILAAMDSTLAAKLTLLIYPVTE